MSFPSQGDHDVNADLQQSPQLPRSSSPSPRANTEQQSFQETAAENQADDAQSVSSDASLVRIEMTREKLMQLHKLDEEREIRLDYVRQKYLILQGEYAPAQSTCNNVRAGLAPHSDGNGESTSVQRDPAELFGRLSSIRTSVMPQPIAEDVRQPNSVINLQQATNWNRLSDPAVTATATASTATTVPVSSALFTAAPTASERVPFTTTAVFSSTIHGSRRDASRPSNAFSWQANANEVPDPVPSAYISQFPASTRFSVQSNLTTPQVHARQSVPRELPTFSGRPEEWPIFIATYDWSTNVCGLTDAENLVRLQKALKGEALAAVQHILVHPTCVSAALSMLKMLFGQPEKILFSIKNRIKSMPRIDPNKLETITTFAVDVKGLQATIEASGLSQELENSSLLQELIDKLPAYLQLTWGTHKLQLQQAKRQPNLNDFANWIFDYGLSASNVCTPSLSSTNTRKSKPTAYKAHLNLHSEQRSANCLVCSDKCASVAQCNKFSSMSRSQRWNEVRRLNLCKQCLKQQHSKHKCETICGVEGCHFRHHALLHRYLSDSKPNTQCTLVGNCHAHVNATHKMLFKIIPVTVYKDDNHFIETFAFIDEGSSISLVDEDIANQLNITGKENPLCLKWTGDLHRIEDNSREIVLNIAGKNRRGTPIKVHTVSNLGLPKQSLNYEELSARFNHLKNLPVQGYQNAVPKILIGLNNSSLCTPQSVRENKIGDPVAVRTRLGWMIYGGATYNESMAFMNVHVCECEQRVDAELNDLVKKFFLTENSGVNITSVNKLGDNDERALKSLQENTRQVATGKYESALLWRFDDVTLPNSYQMAKNRLVHLERRLSRDIPLADTFERTINDYLRKGYIRKLNQTEIVQPDCKTPVWYLPIFAVFNKNKPGKARVVWDAAAKTQGVSLNSMLLKGPDLLTPLIDVLFRFRQRAIALNGDIEEMFLQVQTRLRDQQAQRFLWRSRDAARAPDVYVMQVMMFGAACSPCIAQFVKNLNAKKFEQTLPRAAQAVTENHYVDDYLDSVDTTTEAIALARDVKYIHSQGGFHIRNWCSNSIEVLKSVGENVAQANVNISGSSDMTEKVLGVYWIPQEDVITFEMSPVLKNSPLLSAEKVPTKRQMLSILMSVYDPLGLIANILCYAKILLQEVWRSNIAWDEEILPNQMTKWQQWTRILPKLKELKLPRCYLTGLSNYDDCNVQLHTFVDASENAYSAACYLRITARGLVVRTLIGSKAKVAPLKPTSIPRLELMAAVIGARFAEYICRAHTIQIHEKVFWTDSKTVLSWLQSDHRKYHQFVALRVSEILDLSELREWRWVPTNHNVADEATKWATLPDPAACSRWFNGPDFLALPESAWPSSDTITEATRTDIKQASFFHITIDKPLIDVQRFSKWSRLLRTTAYILHFVNTLKTKLSRTATPNGILQQAELKEAEFVLYRLSQKLSYNMEIQELRKNGSLPKSSSIYKLSPYIDDHGVLRADSRIQNAYMIDELKQPIILSQHDYLTFLIMQHYHSKYHHANHETAINELRQLYQIPRLRAAYRRAIKLCQMCKISKATPCAPQMARLPRARLAAFVAPFTFTGIDFFGPINVTVNRHKEKRYGVLFTCLSVRAIHIEIAHSLNTSSCILSIRNFMSRRGIPREIFTDNGTNFVGAERELRAAVNEIDRNDLVEAFTTSFTKWNFNPPSAPHMGGAWERLVRSIKSTLYKIRHMRYPNDELLLAMMAEIENIINSRPLAYLPIDHENAEALTPNHFLLGSSNGMKPLAEYSDEPVLLRSTWLTSQLFAQQFWTKWVKEYLPNISCRTKWHEKTKPLQVGDLVVIVDPENPRNVWPRGKVIEIRAASDGQVRSAKVLTTKGILERPVLKLAVLDVAKNEE